MGTLYTAPHAKIRARPACLGLAQDLVRPHIVRMNRRAFLELASATALGAGALKTKKARRRPAPDAPFVTVLGTVQDAGFPQVGCYSERCDRARLAHRLGEGRYVSSLAVTDPGDLGGERIFLVDATPDITRQIDLIKGETFRERLLERRPFDGIFLTHAHIGHYLGLALLGNEGLGVLDVPVYCTESMSHFLRSNEPWALMVRQGRIVPTPLDTQHWHRISDQVEVQLLRVPHRDELSDTVCFLFRGPSRLVLLYLPDINSWSAWGSWDGPKHDIRDVVASVNVAMLDGSFWSASELPGRAIEDIPHPLIPDTMELLQGAATSTRRIEFTHLNNSNPVLDEDSVERREVQRRGFHVAREGRTHPL